MANKTFATYLSELSEVSSLGAGDKLPVLESSTVKYVDGGDIGGTSYLKYVALISQTGTSAPTATVLENTLGGTVVWTRNDVGDYTGTLASAFTLNKTWCFSANTSFSINPIGRNDSNSVSLINLALFPTTEIADDFEASIEIRVYP